MNKTLLKTSLWLIAITGILCSCGPLELKDSKAGKDALKITRIDCVDDYQKPGERPGNPEIIQDYITPGLLDLIGQGVYHASPEVSFGFPSSLSDFSKPVGLKKSAG